MSNNITVTTKLSECEVLSQLEDLKDIVYTTTYKERRMAPLMHLMLTEYTGDGAFYEPITIDCLRSGYVVMMDKFMAIVTKVESNIITLFNLKDKTPYVVSLSGDEKILLVGRFNNARIYERSGKHNCVVQFYGQYYPDRFGVENACVSMDVQDFVNSNSYWNDTHMKDIGRYPHGAIISALNMYIYECFLLSEYIPVSERIVAAILNGSHGGSVRTNDTCNKNMYMYGRPSQVESAINYLIKIEDIAREVYSRGYLHLHKYIIEFVNDLVGKG